MREDLADRVRAFGPVLSREVTAATRALFAPLQEPRPYAGITLTRDRQYGADPRQRLDVFSSGGSGKPVFVFVHGGGFVRGDKSDPDGPFPFYENLGVWAVRQGFVGVPITYRYATDHRWPSGAEDIGAALRWLHANVAAHGGDAQRIVLMGQSAGATHVASYAGLAEHHAAPGGGVRGYVVFSGVYDFVAFGVEDGLLAYLGDRRRAAETSPLTGLATTPLPLLLANSELDPLEFHVQTKMLYDARYAHLGEHSPDYLYLPGHNHISQVAHLGAAGVEESIASERLANYIRRITA
jgi:triacylglycerol lipase